MPALLLCESRAGGEAELPVYDDRRPAGEQFEALARVCGELCALSQNPGASRSYKQKLIAYLDGNFSSPDMYAGYVADKFLISTKQVCRIVQEYTSLGFSDYLESLRLAKAVELLTGTGESVNNIALACGFSSANTFYKAFKKAHGVAPGQYRKA